jgi:5-formyltetrahydrofolate cyclo-ligase
VGNDPRNPFAKKLPYQGTRKIRVDLIVTDALAVGVDGSRLGDGRGFLDLQYAILDALGWLSPNVQVAAVVEEARIRDALPMEEQDIGVHWIVAPGRIVATALRGRASPRIFWDKLSRRDIKRNDALFFLDRSRGPGAPE